MIAVIMLSYRYKMNPDNLATPLAASIGDVVSISILSTIASEFYYRLNEKVWVLYVVLGLFLILLPIWIIIVLKNKYTRNVLKSGWVPILTALLISGLVKNQNNILDFIIFRGILSGWFTNIRINLFFYMIMLLIYY